MNYGEKIRKLYDVSATSAQLNNLLEVANRVGFKRASGFGRRVGGSRERDALSEYEYINTRAVTVKRELRRAIKEVSTLLNVQDHMLINNFLRLQPSDFLDWQDYYLWKHQRQVIGTKVTTGSPFNFFSIALTEGNIVEFKDKLIHVPIYHGIVFSPADVHRIPKVDNTHTWLIFGIPYHLDVGELLEQGVACK
jgi:hypothetical protein